MVSEIPHILVYELNDILLVADYQQDDHAFTIRQIFNSSSQSYRRALQLRGYPQICTCIALASLSTQNITQLLENRKHRDGDQQPCGR